MFMLKVGYAVLNSQHVGYIHSSFTDNNMILSYCQTDMELLNVLGTFFDSYATTPGKLRIGERLLMVLEVTVFTPVS